jgi:Flp pilus assembly protein TadG
MRAPARLRRRSQRGNAFVEMAFVMLPLFAILFAIVDFGFAIFLRSTFQHAVREGTRYAVTYQTIGGKGHDDSIKSVVQTSAMGFLAGDDGLQKIKIRYFNPDTLVETAANAPGNLVEVSVEGYQWGWLAPLLRTDTPLTITTRSSDRMEGLPLGMSVPPAR